MSRKPEPTRKAQTPIRTHTSPPIHFDPRWAKATTCKPGCAKDAPCDNAVHGGYRIGLLAAVGPTKDWPQKLKTAVCVLCACQAGAVICASSGPRCACHGARPTPPDLGETMRQEVPA